MTYPETPASSVMSYATSGGRWSTASTENAMHSTRSKKHRRRRSQELFEVEWENDGDVSACFVCKNDFSMIKRKHHCRRCGHVICSDCSSFWRFPATHRKHRVCSYCSANLADGRNGQMLGSPASSIAASDMDLPTPDRHRRRDKFRESIIGVFSSENKKKKKKNAGIPPTPSQEASGSRSDAHDPALFNTNDDDTWFVDPVDHGEEDHTASRRSAYDSQQKRASTTMTSMLHAGYARPQKFEQRASLYDAQFGDVNSASMEEHEAPRDSKPPRSAPVSEERQTFSESFRSIFVPRKGRRKSKGKDASSGDQDEHDVSGSNEPSSSSASLGSEEPSSLLPSLKNGPDRPTFYSADIDELVVDDSPGYYESVNEKHKHRRSEPKVASMPRPEPPSMPVVPEETPEPVKPVGSGTTSVIPSTRAENSGLAGALKRLFGMTRNKAADTTKSATKESANPVSNESASLVSDDIVEVSSSVTGNASPDTESIKMLVSQRSIDRRQKFDDLVSDDEIIDSLDGRYTMVDSRRLGEQSENVSAMRHTMGGYMMPSSVGSDSLVRASAIGGVTDARSKKRSEQGSTRERSGTFDELFDSPKAKKRPSSKKKMDLPSRSWTSDVNYHQDVGVNRFDRAPTTKNDEDDFVRTLGLPTTGGMESPTPAKTPWSAVSGFAGRDGATVDSASGATSYAVISAPSSMAESYRETYDQPRSTIMDEFRPKPKPSSKSQERDTIDDYFADFENPTEYVFDTTTGTYVPAKSLASSTRKPERSSYQTSYTEPHEKYSYIQESHDVPLSMSMLSRPEEEEQVLRRDPARRGQQEDVDMDPIDATIVDKISSLEGELQALKQLLRQRVHSPRSSTSARKNNNRSSTSYSADAHIRKQSIFEGSSSDDDSPMLRKMATRKKRPVEATVEHDDDAGTNGVKQSKRKSQRGKSRKDSFADLFEDEKPGKALGGRSYEALFQIGAQSNGQSDESDDSDRKQVSLRRRKEKSRRKQGSSKKFSSSDADRQEAQKEEVSRFGKQKKSPSQRGDPYADTSKGDELLVKPSAKSVPKRRRKDAIDSLFDSDDADDLTKFYEESNPDLDDNSAKNLAREHIATKSTRTVMRADPSEMDDEDGLATPAVTQTTASNGTISSAHIDSDEEFASTLKTLRKGRSSTSLVRRTSSKSESVSSAPAGPSLDVDSDDEFVANLKERKRPSGRSSAGGSTLHESESQKSIAQSDVADGMADLSVEDDIQGSPECHETVDAIAIAQAGVDSVPVIEADISLEARDSAKSEVETITSITHEVEEVAKPATEEGADFDPLALLDEDTRDVSGPRRKSKRRSKTAEPEESSIFAVPTSGVDSWWKASSFASEDASLRDSTLDDPFSSVLGTSDVVDFDVLMGSYGTNDTSRDSELGLFSTGNDEQEETVSFEIKPKKKKKKAVVQDVPVVVEDAVEKEDNGAHEATNAIDPASTELEPAAAPVEEAMTSASTDLVLPEASLVGSGTYDSDWQRMQEEEKERRKKLQMKQRQAQREKLKKQPSNVRSLGKSSSSGRVPSSPTNSHSNKHEKSKDKKRRKKRGEENEEIDFGSQKSRSLLIALSIGISGYLSFLDNVSIDVIQNYDFEQKRGLLAFWLLVPLAALFCVPYQFIVFRHTCEFATHRSSNADTSSKPDVLFRAQKSASQVVVSQDEEKDVECSGSSTFTAIMSLILIIQFSTFFVHDIARAMSLTGGLGGIALCFVIPPICHLKLIPSDRSGSNWCNEVFLPCLSIGVGGILSIACAAINIAQMWTAHEDD
ncbi:hypothetical protein Poli38472_008655 [Pythium oligandrum]|uniref:FYVE-type domain-containing protein n=1 Tax=Pythium oligandrum TaxID=41045 RepID=A0A8K1C4K1_PYTOL|nr:hypothetical protein Poli38472_008655 [Pythium oligandrum]|eukprot:TMW56007.1 hypothetical protein Poli38472_008655 [Pythium oligandrum]